MVALITGGARMGGTLAEALADRGYDVALSWASSQSAAEGAADAVRARGQRALTVQLDVRDPAACRSAIDQVVAWGGRLDVLIALASTFDRVSLDDLTADEWRRQLAVDLDGSFHCAHAAALHMRARRAGHIVLCSDWVAASGRPRYAGYTPYYVAKAGVIALTKSLGKELAGHDIAVNCVTPAAARTAIAWDRSDIYGNTLAINPEDQTALRLNRILAHHTGKTEEQIAKDADRDNYMSAAQAAEYGLVDKVLENKKQISDVASK